jgi:plastocyanin
MMSYFGGRSRRVMILVFGLTTTFIFAAACSSGGNKTRNLGSFSASDHGTKDVTTSQTLELEVDSYYFEPTFLRGAAGQALTLEIKNDAKITHNFSVKGQASDMDIPAEGTTAVKVTFPQSGVVQFFCKYHTGQGMNGELLVGNATPQPPQGTGQGAGQSNGSGY